jgi:cystathionine beta-lyase/cystathionine gamma-synthase
MILPSDDVRMTPENAHGRMSDATAWTARTTPVVPPIYHAVTYGLDDKSYEDIENGGLNETWYGRFSNPTVSAAAEPIRRLEGTAAALLTGSGMAAIATTLVTLLRAGDRVVAARAVYGDTRDLLTRDLPAFGITVDLVDGHDLDAWRSALSAGPVALAYGETLANPTLRLLDIAAVAELAHAVGAKLVVDNTFATPFAVRPAALGADVVVESATKFLSGHSDLIAGAVLSDVDTIRAVQRRLITFGGVLDPNAAYLLWRGLQTFDVRLARQTSSAARLAAALADRDDVARVVHPSRPDHPQHALAMTMMPRGTAMLTIEVAGGDRRALGVLRELALFTEATSLGGVESLASTPFNSSHFSLSPADRAAAGIGPGTLRLSVGLEDPAALLADLTAALDATREDPR